MTEPIRFDDPKPIGVHAAAIDHLVRARELMDSLQISDGAGNHLTLAGVFDQQISAVIRSIDAEYKRSWREIATRPLIMTFEALAHSRDCGWHKHDHGPACHANCPTCHGKAMT